MVGWEGAENRQPGGVEGEDRQSQSHLAICCVTLNSLLSLGLSFHICSRRVSDISSLPEL